MFWPNARLLVGRMGAMKGLFEIETVILVGGV
jgi:hypothetical protein